MSIHPSQIITGSDLSIRWSPTESISNFVDLGIISAYSFSLQWQTKTTIPVNKLFEESAKLSLKGTLNLTALTDKNFQMPDPYVWIEIGLLIKDLPNGDKWRWNRTGKFLVLSDTQSLKPDDMVEHQYSLTNQGAITFERVLVPAIEQVYWKESLTSDLQVMTDFGSITALKIL